MLSAKNVSYTDREMERERERDLDTLAVLRSSMVDVTSYLV